MKNLYLAAVILVPCLSTARAEFLVQPDDVVGICGDSITEQHIYSRFMEDYLLMCQPTANQKIVQFGWSGEQAPAFVKRLDTDIFPFKPTVVTTCYGMNDGHYGPLTDVTADTYEKAQTESVEALKKNGVRVIVLGSAKCVDSATYHAGDVAGAVIYNKTLASLADIDKKIAGKEGVVYADVNGVTMATMKKAKAKFGEDYNFAGGDGVHPGPNGHLVMAYAFLKALGCDGNIGTITVDYGAKKATATSGQEIVSYLDGKVDVKSTRYPFCFSGTDHSKDPTTTAAITTCFPFNEDLNRYTLVVKGLTSAKAKVTWGNATKEYDAAALAKGINLAADFLENPFVAQFNQVDAAVAVQEAQETVLSKSFMHNTAVYRQVFPPDVGASFDQILASAMAQHDSLFKTAADLVIPIEHTIQIVPTP